MRSRYTSKFFRHPFSIVVSTVVIFVFFMLPVKVLALSCAHVPFTLAEAYELADSIIVGVVTDCKEETSSDPWTDGGIDCSFVSVEVLKEASSVRDYSGVTSSSYCGLYLREGDQYLLFLDSGNKPLQTSVRLNGGPEKTLKATSYISILRKFRDGVTADLSEPWIFRGHENSCSLVHGFRGNSISFDRNKPGAQDSMSRETIDGKTVSSGWVHSQTTNPESPLIYVKFVEAGDAPKYPIGTQILTIRLKEQMPAPLRQVTLTVGSQSWQLYRVEQSVSINKMPANKSVRYIVGGEVAEDILSAISKPSNIVISGVLVGAPNVNGELPPETPQINQEYPIRLPEADAYFSNVPGEPGLVEPDIKQSIGAVEAYRSPRDLSEPEIRLETRSTQLFPATVKSYQDCYVGAKH